MKNILARPAAVSLIMLIAAAMLLIAPEISRAEEAGGAGGGGVAAWTAQGPEAELYHSLEEKKALAFSGGLADVITIGALIEVEASVDDNDRDGDSSGITLATVELGLDAEFTESISGRVLLLWEEATTDPMVVDEGFISLAHPAGAHLTAGKTYLPFGVFNTHFVSDPITLELGETNETTVMGGYARGPFEIAAGVFKAGIDNGSGAKAEDYYAAVTVDPCEGLRAGVYYLSNIAETKWLSGEITSPVGKVVGGWGAFASVERGPVSIELEFLGSARRFLAADLDGDLSGRGDRPRAWNVEAALAINDRTEVAAKVEGSKGFFTAAATFPESQYGLAASYGITTGVTVTAEYLHGNYAGGDDSRNMAAVRLAMGF